MRRDRRILAFCLAMLVPAFISTVAGSETASTQSRLLEDFTSPGANFCWFIVNDSVMGGRSEGSIDCETAGLRFVGRTNTDGGGFSSIRTEDVALDLSRYDGIRLRVRGDGRRYTWRLTTDARWRGGRISYWADFETEAGLWTDVRIPFAAFRPTYRGTELDGPSLDTARIAGMGLMIYDGKDGAFELWLHSIEAYGASTAETAES